MAGFHLKYVLILLLCALAPTASAQQSSKPKVQHSAAKAQETNASRLLTPDEGLAIIGAALDARYHLHSGGDCSHLVHGIYQQAGFPYPYAPSTNLYTGIENFQQVTNPRPGDLAVWRGHAAIVINPAQRSFFSATRSGLRVEHYDSAYWKNRGPVRFFRYVKPAPAESHSVRRNAAVRHPVEEGADQQDSTLAGESGESMSDDPPASTAAIGLPRILVVHAARPKLQQVNETLSQSVVQTDKTLKGQPALKMPDPVLIFDRMRVTSVHLKGNQGWAEIKVDGLSSLTGGRLAGHEPGNPQRWVLTRRDEDSWELLLPAKNTYMQHDVAVRILAHQLASLADNTLKAEDSAKDQAQLVRTLNRLLEK